MDEDGLNIYTANSFPQSPLECMGLTCSRLAAATAEAHAQQQGSNPERPRGLRYVLVYDDAAARHALRNALAVLDPHTPASCVSSMPAAQHVLQGPERRFIVMMDAMVQNEYALQLALWCRGEERIWPRVSLIVTSQTRTPSLAVSFRQHFHGILWNGFSSADLRFCIETHKEAAHAWTSNALPGLSQET